MNINTLTIKAQELLQGAMTLARDASQQSLEPQHILAAAIADDDSLASYLIGRVGANIALLRRDVHESIARLPRVEGGGEVYFSRESSAVVQRAVDLTRTFSDRYASVEHIVAALAKERSAARDIMRNAGITESSLIEAIKEFR